MNCLLFYFVYGSINYIMFTEGNAYQLTGSLIHFLERHPQIVFGASFLDELKKQIENYRNQFQKNCKVEPIAALLETYRAMDAAQKKRKAPAISCRKGCSGCCYLEVQMSRLEARAILEYCKRYGKYFDTAVLRKQAALTGIAYLASPHGKCVFLKDHQCSIYPVRPLACRKHFVYSDPSLCNVKKYPGTARVDIGIDVDVEILLSAILPMLPGGLMKFAQALLSELPPDVAEEAAVGAGI